MAYLRVSSSSEEAWTRRYCTPPRTRRRHRPLLFALATLLGLYGLMLMAEAPLSAAPPRDLPPEPFSRPATSQPGRTVKIVLTQSRAAPLEPETWAPLPTAHAVPVAAAPLADPAEDPAVACREAPTLAAQMTCVDPTLREADQRMTMAYEAVLAAGVSPATLGRSQARWLLLRDGAARSSPEDLLSLYQQRERQLRTFAVLLNRQAAEGRSVAKKGPSQATPSA